MVNDWIASISANKPQENDELIRTLFSGNQIFGFRNLKTIEKDDSICFYSTFSRRIIDNARVSSKIQKNPKLIPDDYPYVIKLVDVAVYRPIRAANK